MDWQNTIKEDVSRVLAEDIGSGDVSAELISDDAQLLTRLLLREDAVLCGTAWFDEVFRQCDPSIRTIWSYKDSDNIKANTSVCEISGPASALLSGERSALNFLQTLSGTATTTRHYAQLIEHTRCRILDTRKTIPNLRTAQKYAVKCGGGINHRVGLFDAFLIKENHIAACSSITTAAKRARQLHPELLLEVEVESLDQMQEAIDVGVDRVLLDNFSLEETEKAVVLNNQRVQLESSGNITEHSLIKIAESGVDFISIGALTKHLHAIDFSLRYV